MLDDPSSLSKVAFVATLLLVPVAYISLRVRNAAWIGCLALFAVALLWCLHFLWGMDESLRKVSA